MDWRGIIIFALALITDAASTDCPTGCQCQQKTTSCSNLNKFPLNIPLDTEVITLSKCEFGTIPGIAFIGLANLKKVSISNSRIGRLKSCVFSDHFGLEIVVSKSSIDTIETFAFTGLSSATINLSAVNITTISSYAFDNITDIKFLFFADVDIGDFQAAALNNIEVRLSMQISESTFKHLSARSFLNFRSPNVVIFNNFIKHSDCDLKESLQRATHATSYFFNNNNETNKCFGDPSVPPRRRSEGICFNITNKVSTQSTTPLRKPQYAVARTFAMLTTRHILKPNESDVSPSTVVIGSSTVRTSLGIENTTITKHNETFASQSKFSDNSTGNERNSTEKRHFKITSIPLFNSTRNSTHSTGSFLFDSVNVTEGSTNSTEMLITRHFQDLPTFLPCETTTMHTTPRTAQTRSSAESKYKTFYSFKTVLLFQMSSSLAFFIKMIL